MNHEPCWQQPYFQHYEDKQFIAILMRPLSKKNREVMNKTLEAKEIKEIAEEMGKNYDAVQRMINRSIKIMASLCALEI